MVYLIPPGRTRHHEADKAAFLVEGRTRAPGTYRGHPVQQASRGGELPERPSSAHPLDTGVTVRRRLAGDLPAALGLGLERTAGFSRIVGPQDANTRRDAPPALTAGERATARAALVGSLDHAIVQLQAHISVSTAFHTMLRRAEREERDRGRPRLFPDSSLPPSLACVEGARWTGGLGLIGTDIN
ncbi:hypothetical protein T492DRAFT_1057806 [Pavlovales sp. CCMP2436]|nr:hypothetical protein T492DRAFT_1057806 [Pavlovales sp. CCMP2436]|mmetsp:Transcript_39522/g.97820  ORF Transcript_39522/g.97820 Transcript_39522/m.97820 type:complete len:186 (+) Transcript_39522:62-619(+)